MPAINLASRSTSSRRLPALQRDDMCARIGTAFGDGVAAILGSLLLPPELSSPIEEVFWLVWKAHNWFHGTMGGPSFDVVAQLTTTGCPIPYRLDFALGGPSESYAVAVELDGHEWHERTPEQVALRNTRDRQLQAVGWTVVHFSGRQVLSDPWGCAETVRAAVYESTRHREEERHAG